MAEKSKTGLDELQDELRRAEESGDSGRQAAAWAQIGQLLLARNQYEEAADQYRKASQLYAQSGLPKRAAKTLNQLGICQVMAGQPAQALESLQLALQYLDSNPDPALQGAVQGNLGLAYSALGDHQSAFKAHKAVMEAADRLGDDALRLNALINLADSSLQDKNYRSAQGFALVALDLAGQLHPHPAVMIINDLLGMISSRLGDLRSALDYHQRAYQAACDFRDPLGQGIALANQGLALEGLTQLEEAAALLEQAEEIFSRANSSYQKKTHADLERIRRSLQAGAGSSP